MPGLTKPKMLSKDKPLKTIVAVLLAQVPQDVELENIKVRVYTAKPSWLRKSVTVDHHRYSIDYHLPDGDNLEGSVRLAYDQQVYEKMVKE